MGRKKQPNAASDAAYVKLPGVALHVARTHPEVWEAFQRLGEKASRAGPLDARTRRLTMYVTYVPKSTRDLYVQGRKRGPVPSRAQLPM